VLIESAQTPVIRAGTEGIERIRGNCAALEQERVARRIAGKTTLLHQVLERLFVHLPSAGVGGSLIARDSTTLARQVALPLFRHLVFARLTGLALADPQALFSS
jgi:hypothetical protein